MLGSNLWVKEIRLKMTVPVYLCYQQKSRTLPRVSGPTTERIGIFRKADDKISQPICWQKRMKAKKKKKRKKKTKNKTKRKRQFLMDNVTNLFRRKRINLQSMYGNFQYEKIVWIFILSIFFGGGCVSFFCLFK